MVARFIHNLRHDLRVYWLSLRTQVRAAAMLRGAFITQIVGMIINNGFLSATWIFFFTYFGSVNGWRAVDYLCLSGVNAFVYGIVSFLAIGIMDLPRHVDTGSFDVFLTKPTSVLGGLASSNVDVTTLGDIIFGVGLVIWYTFFGGHIALGSLVLFLIAILSACIIFFCFAILLPNIIAFYVFDSEKLSRYVGILFLDAGIYPAGVLTGVLRTVFLLLIPALLFSAVPVDILRGLRLEWVLLGAMVALFWLGVTLWLFKRAIQRYESANLIGAR